MEDDFTDDEETCVTLTFDNLDPSIERIVWEVMANPRKTEADNENERRWETDLMVRKSIRSHGLKQYATAIGNHACCKRGLCQRLGRCAAVRRRGEKGWDWVWGIIMPACIAPHDFQNFNEDSSRAVDPFMKMHVELQRAHKMRQGAEQACVRTRRSKTRKRKARQSLH